METSVHLNFTQIVSQKDSRTILHSDKALRAALVRNKIRLKHRGYPSGDGSADVIYNCNTKTQLVKVKTAESDQLLQLAVPVEVSVRHLPDVEKP